MDEQKINLATDESVAPKPDSSLDTDLDFKNALAKIESSLDTIAGEEIPIIRDLIKLNAEFGISTVKSILASLGEGKINDLKICLQNSIKDLDDPNYNHNILGKMIGCKDKSPAEIKKILADILDVLPKVIDMEE